MSTREGDFDCSLDEPGRNDAGNPDSDFDLLRSPCDLPRQVRLTIDGASPPRPEQGVKSHPQDAGRLWINLWRRENPNPPGASPDGAIPTSSEQSNDRQDQQDEECEAYEPRKSLNRNVPDAAQNTSAEAVRVQQEPRQEATRRRR
jgi:hypothetical protein